MTKPQNRIIEHLKRELGSDFINAETPKEKRIFIRIMPTGLRKAVNVLKQEYPELRLITISTVDHGLDHEFLHHFHVNGDGLVVTLRSVKSKEDNMLESIVDLIPAAHFIEREIADLFGVKLTNHPKPEPLILSKDWPNEKRPLRRSMEGELPPQARPSAETLISTSCVTPISAFIQKKREEAGLPRTPPFAFTDDKAMQEFQGIMKNTGFAEKAGYDWEKKRLRYK
ncbi:MAG TPA: NADH-quinone oxidoreductase subunit C [Candidatus Krumholzibacteriaceae bacterium]|jgi:Ni,Fe-hydrogenase III component G|nr:NADH-quinone oxidoreductase subunit C [Candidatus Krumholzibacteriaceae bacterium]